MHPTALHNVERFCATYLRPDHRGYFVVEIGSQNVQSVTRTLRNVLPPNAEYVGVDMVAGNNVDVVLADPYRLPFETGSVDVCVASSMLEHCEMFWLLFLEVLRVLSPSGLFYLNVPSNGDFHRFPVDCWRFYPDSGNALVMWARHSGINAALLESYVGAQKSDIWNDFVAVFIKDAGLAGQYPNRITDQYKEFFNGLVFGNAEFRNYQALPEDRLKLRTIEMILSGQMAVR